MSWMMFLSPLLAFAVAVALLLWMLHRPPAWLPLDIPNARSLHTRPIPRAGGLALLGGALPAWLLAGVADAAWLVPALALALVSWMDDRRGLPVTVRLVFQCGAAAILLFAAGGSLPIWLVMLPALVWMTNLYNFMDGADGLAGGMALFGFGCYALAAALAGDASMMMVNLVLAVAALAFLLFNFHPARVFMGDVGSIPLGFLAAALGYVGWQRGLWPALFPLLVFSPFIVDSSTTLMRRALARERLWQAHKSHYYQRLVRMGLGHRHTALAEYALMLACGLTALFTLEGRYTLGIVLFWVGLYAVMMGWIDHRWRVFARGNG